MTQLAVPMLALGVLDQSRTLGPPRCERKVLRRAMAVQTPEHEEDWSDGTDSGVFVVASLSSHQCVWPFGAPSSPTLAWQGPFQHNSALPGPRHHADD